MSNLQLLFQQPLCMKLAFLQSPSRTQVPGCREIKCATTPSAPHLLNSLHSNMLLSRIFQKERHHSAQQIWLLTELEPLLINHPGLLLTVPGGTVRTASPLQYFMVRSYSKTNSTFGAGIGKWKQQQQAPDAKWFHITRLFHNSYAMALGYWGEGRCLSNCRLYPAAAILCIVLKGHQKALKLY